MASEYCVRCGNYFGSTRFCTSCGSPRDGEFDDVVGETVVKSLPQTTPASAPPTRSTRTLVTVLIALVVVIVAGASAALGAALLRGDDGGEAAKTSEPAPRSDAIAPADPPSSIAPADPPSSIAPADPPSSVAPVVPAVPAFTGCPSGFTYAGTGASDKYNICFSENVISEGFAKNIAATVTGPGPYSGVYSASRDQQYYFTCKYAPSSTVVIDCGYPPTNITQGGIVRLYPTK